MFFTSKEEKLIIQFLSSSPFFSGASSRSLRNLVKKFIPTPIKSGHYVMKQGDVGASLYLVMHGRLRVLESRNGITQELGEIGAGEFIGEIALLSDSTRFATVYAIRDSLLLKLSQADFYNFSKNHHEQLISIIKHTITRLKDKNFAKNKPKTFCLIPAGGSTHLRTFSHAFINTLKGKTLYLTQHNINSKFRDAGIDIETSPETDISQWFNEQENIYNQVIYESGPELNTWCKLCIRQADRILLIANRDENHLLNPIEKYLFDNSNCAKDLIVLQDQSAALPRNSRPWLKDRPIQSHHQVCIDKKETLSRLLRYLNNKSMALVLGGGGARGLCHIGVYKALLEKKIPIDCVAGTSSGAVVGALLAMDMDFDAIIELVKEQVVTNKRLFEYTVPIYSFVSGKEISRVLIKMLGHDTHTEDLWRRFFCVSSSLSTLSTKTMNDGLLWKNIRASISLPGIFPPISTDEEELLIDGAVTNNLPVDIMQSFSNKGRIISVNVSGRPHFMSDAIPNGWLSHWEAIKEKFKRKRLPTIPEIIMESLMLCSTQHQMKMGQKSDIHIDCHAEKYNLLNFKKIDEMVDLGYLMAMKELENHEFQIEYT